MLRRGIACAIKQALQEARLPEEELEWTVTFGLSTSELGLKEVPHLIAPVGCEDLAQHICVKRFEDVAPGVFYLVPGVRNHVDPEAFDLLEAIDSMRGEETQIIGALNKMETTLPCFFLFLGSHTKLIRVDSNGCIDRGVTTLSGQVFQALRENTILATAIPEPDDIEADGAVEIDAAMRGYRLEKKYGFLRAAVMVRCLYNLANTSPLDRLAFFEGALAASDMECLQHMMSNSAPCPVIIIGQKWRAQVYERVLGSEFSRCITAIRTLSPQEANDITVCGALTILDSWFRINGFTDGQSRD